MGKFDALIPPDVEVSPKVAAEIMSRAMEDEQGYFDPLKEPARALDAYKRNTELMIKMDNICKGILQNALLQLLKQPGDHVIVNMVDVEGTEQIISENPGVDLRLVIVNHQGMVLSMTPEEYHSIYG